MRNKIFFSFQQLKLF